MNVRIIKENSDLGSFRRFIKVDGSKYIIIRFLTFKIFNRLIVYIVFYSEML